MTRRRSTNLALVEPEDTDRLYDRVDVCARLKIGKTKYYDLIRTGELPAVLQGDEIRVRASDLAEYIRSLPRYVPSRHAS